MQKLNFTFNIYKDDDGFFIASDEYKNLFGWSPTLKEVHKHAKDIALLFEDGQGFITGQALTDGMHFVKKITVTLKPAL